MYLLLTSLVVIVHCGYRKAIPTGMMAGAMGQFLASPTDLGEGALTDGGKGSAAGTGAKVTVWGSGRAKVTVSGSGRAKVTVRRSGRAKVNVRGSGRAKVNVRGSGRG